MALRKRTKNMLIYTRSARQDVRAWAMFLIGVVFVLTALSVDPQKNCNDAGECAPWLIPIAFVVGGLVGLGGLGQLLANPNRGSRIDPETGDLIWWQNRFGESGGDEGRINPAQISLIRIRKVDEGSDQIHLYDQDGARLFYFDEEVVPWDLTAWAAAMVERWPHIRIETIG
jgi:hypothetical protein